MGKDTKKENAPTNAQRRSSSIVMRKISKAIQLDRHHKPSTEPGALAVNPLSPDASNNTSSHSFHSDSSNHLMDGSHSSSNNQVTSPVVTMARRKTHHLAATSIPIDVNRNSNASYSAAEPGVGVPGAHAMMTRASASAPTTHKLQVMPAGSHAALCRQAHNANSKQRRLSMSSSSHHSRNSTRSIVVGNNMITNSNITSNHADGITPTTESGLRRSSDRRSKMGHTRGLSSRQSVGSIESIGMITNEVDVDELYVGKKTTTQDKAPPSSDDEASSSQHPRPDDIGMISPRAISTFNGHSTAALAEYDVSPMNMISAHLVVEDEEEEDEEAPGGKRRMTEEERNALFEQAQRQAEEALHEKMMSNMVTAEAVVDEEAMKQQARRRQWCTGCCILALLILVIGLLVGKKPWKRNSGSMDDTTMHGPPPPDNDVCTAAITMEWGTNTQWQEGTTIGASDSKLPSCTSDDEFVWGKNSVWYRIVGTGTPLRITSNATLAAMNDGLLHSNTSTIPWDAVLSVYSGQCGDLMCIGSTSNEDRLVATNKAEPTTDHDASVTWFAEAGVDYFVCVHGAYREEGTREDDPYSGTTYGGIRDEDASDATPVAMMNMGNFSLSVDQAVGNDFCPGAVDLEVSNTDTMTSSYHHYHQGSTNQATIDSDYDFCGNTESTAAGVWYRVNGTGNPLEVIVRPQDNNNFNTQVTVFKSPMGLDCSELMCITGDNELFQHSSHATWLSEEGTVYFVLVHGVSNHRGSFELVIEERVTNDLCESATALEIPEDDLSGKVNALIGTTEGSSLASTLGVCGNAIHAGRNVWYTLEGTGRKMRMSTCHSASSSLESNSMLSNMVLSVFRGEDCSNLECIDGNDSFSCGSTTSGAVEWDTEAGQVYHVLVSGKLEETGTFQLSWEVVE